MKLTLLSHTKDIETLVTAAAKLCYSESPIEELMNSTEKERENFIKKIIDMGHESVLEHISFTFAVEGVSRITEQQLTRHRIASYSISSSRYINRDNATFYKSNPIKEYDRVNKTFDVITAQCRLAYEEIRIELMFCMIKKYSMQKKIMICDTESYSREDKEKYINSFKEKYRKQYSKLEKIACENARLVLPGALETRIIFTMNARSLINFLHHRLCNRAQKEIRVLANMIYEEVIKLAPNVFSKAMPSCVYGKCKEGKLSCDNPIRKVKK